MLIIDLLIKSEDVQRYKDIIHDICTGKAKINSRIEQGILKSGLR